MFRYILLISLAVGFAVPAQADSLWSPAQTPLFSVAPRSIRVGDIITIFISASTSAVQEASTRTSKESELEVDFVSNWDQIANILGNETIRKRYEGEIEGDDEFRGLGQTSRKSQVKAVVTAVVTEILDTGNLFVVGEHKVKVNDEVETVRVSGVVRPSDITPQNSVFSYQIAKAEISVIGSGVVAAKQKPGVLTRMFSWFF